MSKYRILYIESGDYLYGYNKHTELTNLFSVYELDRSADDIALFYIYEVASKKKAEEALNFTGGILTYSRNQINKNDYSTLFEIVEVLDE